MDKDRSATAMGARSPSPNPSARRLAIFDHDGVLVDSMDLHRQAWLSLGERSGLPITPEFIHETFGMTNFAILKQLMKDDYSDELAGRFGDLKEIAYRDVARGQIQLLEGMRDLLDALRSADYRLAIGSSGPLANLELTVQEAGLDQHFQAIASLEDIQRSKPDPQVFLVAAEKVGVPPSRSVVFEDAIVGVKAAKAAGMIAVAVTTTCPAQVLYDAGADRVLERIDRPAIEELLAWLDERLGP